VICGSAFNIDLKENKEDSIIGIEDFESKLNCCEGAKIEDWFALDPNELGALLAIGGWSIFAPKEVGALFAIGG